ncbi:MAG TPA: STAS domain-containing protein [Patescibacteria group bacterium]|nr:STAS domain-containing protein [Patescibacteria group bacterium]
MVDFDVRGTGTLRVVSLPVAVDDRILADLKAVLTGAINDGGRKIMCDLAQTTFISAGAIQALTDMRKLLRKLNGELGFLHTLPAIRVRFEKEGVAYLFKFYDIEESVSVLILNILVKYFDRYEDLGDLRTSHSGATMRVEVQLLFAGHRTMREVQELIDVISKELQEQQPQVQLLVIAGAQPETVPAATDGESADWNRIETSSKRWHSK